MLKKKNAKRELKVLPEGELMFKLIDINNILVCRPLH